MRRIGIIFAATWFGFALFGFAGAPNVYAQQTDFETAKAKAETECTTVWSDPAFDTLRTKIPLGGEKPTMGMLTNREKLLPKDRPLADLALKAQDKCRKAQALAVAMLPPRVQRKISTAEREQDALIAELYNGKITFGEFNVAANRLHVKLYEALYGVQKPPEAASAPVPKPAEVKIPPPRPQLEQTNVAASNRLRLALVIGNSKYANLPKLSNPANDARAVADVFQKMGYRTQLLLDASDQNIRQAIRAFANESEKADTAVVFYAGHGAQVNGYNYLLPVDIDIPRTEVDIQLTGLKVDDLVNSVRSTVKIVFLDACRDNPALFKNIVRGRGASAVGLAPASASNLNQTSGGGVFIAYATDAGAVADDGKGKHSPFTEALLKNLQKPISIDDMFSLVTKEVRLVTKNAQRPYKYASLESIVCMPPACSNDPIAPMGDVFQEAKKSEADELQIALATKNVDALETYLEKYPNTAKRRDILAEIGRLRRAEYSEWTIFEFSREHDPQYIRLNTIQNYGNRASARIKYASVPGKKLPDGQPLPAGAYQEDISVYDCTKLWMAYAEITIYSESGGVIYSYKWGDPRFLNLGIGFEMSPTSIGARARDIACREQSVIFHVSKKQLSTNQGFQSLSSTLKGDGDIFFREISTAGATDRNLKEVLLLFKMKGEQQLKLGDKKDLVVKYRNEVDHFVLNCTENSSAIMATAYYDSDSQNLIHLATFSDLKWNQHNDFSPLAALREIVCNKEFAGVGIQVDASDGNVNVIRVIDGMPADKAGIKVGDIITQIDNEPVQNLTLEKVIEKLRGGVDTEVKLQIKRQEQSIELTALRTMVRTQSSQSQEKK